MAQYFLINKPYGYLSQFTREAPNHKVLGDLHPFPKQVYPVGRLDRDSEGLLILTDDKQLNAALLSPARQHPRTYWVQVEGTPTPEALNQLRTGVTIRIKKKEHHCAPVVVREIPTTETTPIPPRIPPVRYRATVPDTWLELQLTEGKNRQVRRMCAAVGLPVLRLIRVAIEDVRLQELPKS
ncbi:MAG: pseudouridine synthase, partial [Bacteroidota bacterium]